MEEVMKQILSPDQKKLVLEFDAHHGIDPNQISFKGDSLEPIFDYKALSVLRLKLTDIVDMHASIEERDHATGLVTARCTATLPSSRSVSDLGTAYVGETLGNGMVVANMIEAQNVALARALRRAIRAAGVNLLKAHQLWLQLGTIAQSDPLDGRKVRQRELHALRDEWGDSDEQYRDFIERLFGVRSSLQLNDEQMSQLVSTYRKLIAAKSISLEKFPVSETAQNVA
jgi:hypothetical protein